MVKYGNKIIACMAMCALISGCAGQSVYAEESSQETVNSEETVHEASQNILRAITITEVFGDGEKPSALALEYPSEIDMASLSVEDFEVEGQTITDVYTNTEAALTDSSVPGNFVILKFAYENSESKDSMGGGMGGMSGGQNGGRSPESMGENPDRNMDGGAKNLGKATAVMRCSSAEAERLMEECCAQMPAWMAVRATMPDKMREEIRKYLCSRKVRSAQQTAQCILQAIQQ
ncbi:MAG: hypothetical protein SO016_00290 [Lachnospiraceae bacterium]|nr:hypothetical protein [Lachnospiraceae bacterium]